MTIRGREKGEPLSGVEKTQTTFKEVNLFPRSTADTNRNLSLTTALRLKIPSRDSVCRELMPDRFSTSL
jgi:hypothetical protein